MESGSKREWKSVCICFPGSFLCFFSSAPLSFHAIPHEMEVAAEAAARVRAVWWKILSIYGNLHGLTAVIPQVFTTHWAYCWRHKAIYWQHFLLISYFFFYHRKLGAFTGAFWAVWQRLLFSLYVCCFPLILLYKRSHLCLKGRSVCKSVCNDWDEECEWAEKCRRHMFVAYSLSVLTSLSECMAQSSTGSWSPATECYITLVLLTLQIGSSRLCFGAEDEVWLNMVIDIDI